MKKNVGLWIDHQKAVIVFVTGTNEETKLIHSNIDNSGAARQADDIRQSVLTEHLKVYYETVISSIRNAESILIFGPGEAKGELKKRLVIDNLDDRIAKVETADKMTDPQIAAKVREYFLPQNAAVGS